jgi:hypothetical protein
MIVDIITILFVVYLWQIIFAVGRILELKLFSLSIESIYTMFIPFYGFKEIFNK